MTKSMGTLRPLEYIMPRSKKVSAVVGALANEAHCASAISNRAIVLSPVALPVNSQAFAVAHPAPRPSMANIKRKFERCFKSFNESNLNAVAHIGANGFG